jgi:hypothetical protein
VLRSIFISLTSSKSMICAFKSGSERSFYIKTELFLQEKDQSELLAINHQETILNEEKRRYDNVR